MINVLYTKFEEPLPTGLFTKYMDKMPPVLQAGVNRYKNWQERTAHLLGKTLLLKAFSKLGYHAAFLNFLNYDRYNRPGIGSVIDFNISHSGKYVMCAICEGNRLGIDVEEIKPLDFNDFEDVMTKDQWGIISFSPEPLKEFFRFWTIKESVIKADSRGLGIPLNAIVIRDNIAEIEGKKWQLTELTIDPGYSAFLAAGPLDEAPAVVLDFYSAHSL